MGQYAGQPDFGTFAASVTPSDTISYANNLDRSVIYIGAITGGTDLKVILSGVTRDGQVVETNITDGGTGYTGATGVATTGGSGSGHPYHSISAAVGFAVLLEMLSTLQS
jgi:hypothetical protein